MALRTGNNDKEPIILYDYQPSRNDNHTVTFLRNFKGYVHSDGYPGYSKFSSITRCRYWAYLRRKFIEAVPAKKAEGTPLTAAEIGQDYCNQLFKIEESLKNLSAASRYLQCQKLEKAVPEVFCVGLKNYIHCGNLLWKK